MYVVFTFYFFVMQCFIRITFSSLQSLFSRVFVRCLIGCILVSMSCIYLHADAINSTDFVTTWKTDNLSPGSSNSTSITIPTHPFGYYHYQVDWNNDGDYSDPGEPTYHGGNATHDFGVADTYTVRIR